MSEISPCMTCGVYRVYFRVSFYQAEADDAGGLMSSVLTEPLTPFLRCMSDANQRQSHCVVLLGDIGDAARCTIYENRSSPCREFVMSGENGEENDACDQTWTHYGLPSLRPLYRDIFALNGAESTMRERSVIQSPAS